MELTSPNQKTTNAKKFSRATPRGKVLKSTTPTNKQNIQIARHHGAEN